MTKRQKDICNSGIDELRIRDFAYDACLASDDPDDVPLVREISTRMLVLVTEDLLPIVGNWPCAVPHGIESKPLTESNIREIKQKFSKEKPSLVISGLGEKNGMNYDQTTPYYWLLEEFAATGSTVLHLDSQANML